MNGTKTRSLRVLVVGASGQLGKKIVRALFATRKVDVRVTHRASTSEESLAALREMGAETALADLSDKSALMRACHGVDVIVSAVQGLRDVIVDGQTTLLRAAEEAGVSRMIPSDYALDFFKTDEGKNRNLDLRREFDRVLDASAVKGTSVLNGAFMDLLAYGAMGPDPKSNVFRIFGDIDLKSDFTFTDDVARYVAEVVLDREAPRVVRVSGDTKSPREIAAIFEDVRGKPVTFQKMGTIEDLDRMIERMQKEDPAENDTFPMWQRLQYSRDMQSGNGRLEPLDNARYPAVDPIDIRTLLGRATEKR